MALKKTLAAILFSGVASFGLENQTNAAAYTVIGPATANNLENSGYITPDGQKMYFSKGNTISSQTFNSEMNNWKGLVVELEGGQTPSLTTDGNTMYYKLVEGGIYRAQRTGVGWSGNQALPGLIGYQPTFRNNTLFFTNKDFNEILSSTYDAINNRFGPSSAVQGVNSPADDGLGWVSPNGEELIFTSNRAGGFGGWDIYQATRNSDSGLWGNVTNLGPNVNTSMDEICPTIADEAGKIFFRRYLVDSRGRVLYNQVMSAPLEMPIPEPSALTVLALGAASQLLRRKK